MTLTRLINHALSEIVLFFLGNPYAVAHLLAAVFVVLLAVDWWIIRTRPLPGGKGRGRG